MYKHAFNRKERSLRSCLVVSLKIYSAVYAMVFSSFVVLRIIYLGDQDTPENECVTITTYQNVLIYYLAGAEALCSLFFVGFLLFMCKLRRIHNFEWRKHSCQFVIIGVSFSVALGAETYLNSDMVYSIN